MRRGGKADVQESQTLSPGSSGTMFETPFGKIGLGICYDIRFPELAMIAARQGVSVLSFDCL
jgi:omega-amidase